MTLPAKSRQGANRDPLCPLVVSRACIGLSACVTTAPLAGHHRFGGRARAAGRHSTPASSARLPRRARAAMAPTACSETRRARFCRCACACRTSACRARAASCRPQPSLVGTDTLPTSSTIAPFRSCLRRVLRGDRQPPIRAHHRPDARLRLLANGQEVAHFPTRARETATRITGEIGQQERLGMRNVRGLDQPQRALGASTCRHPSRRYREGYGLFDTEGSTGRRGTSPMPSWS